MSLRNQRRLAAQILKVGEGRVWIDPDRTEDVEAAITREEIRKLVNEGIIRSLQEKGVSRARAKALKEKKKKGLRRGPGRKSGSARAKISKKQAWMKKIRPLRKKLREMKSSRAITESVYRQLYNKAGSGVFESTADLERYIKTRGLGRRR
ncbi:MAG: 50S ribosomal protein L19e [Candidatus Bathyarchaeota archaeon]|nr:MAG: 50S ribosomal protein L19e [Candidatus Bathyarchaeota archaeon]UCE57780.1 MAG: 50S ribosomal protein L19e [Candidatus Bathyarchaeota archaeon]